MNGMANGAIGVLGGGAWGTALAQMAASDGSAVKLWAYEEEVVAAINRDHLNPAFLPGIALSPAISAYGDRAALGDCAMVLVVAPAQHVAAFGRANGAYAVGIGHFTLILWVDEGLADIFFEVVHGHN